MYPEAEEHAREAVAAFDKARAASDEAERVASLATARDAIELIQCHGNRLAAFYLKKKRERTHDRNS